MVQKIVWIDAVTVLPNCNVQYCFGEQNKSKKILKSKNKVQC